LNKTKLGQKEMVVACFSDSKAYGGHLESYCCWYILDLVPNFFDVFSLTWYMYVPWAEFCTFCFNGLESYIFFGKSSHWNNISSSLIFQTLTNTYTNFPNFIYDIIQANWLDRVYSSFNVRVSQLNFQIAFKHFDN